jgi:CheY-like chemotaxis protein
MDKKIRILVVDDEKVIRDGCRRILADNEYEVICVENGEEALSLLEKEPVDVMLLDLKMPVMSGEEVLEQTYRLYPDIPVIIINWPCHYRYRC